MILSTPSQAQMQAGQQAAAGPGAPAYVGMQPQQAQAQGITAQTSPLVAALMSAQQGQGMQTQQSPMSGLPLGALQHLAGQAGQNNGFSAAQNMGLTQYAPSVFSEYSQPIGPGLAGSPGGGS